MYMTQLAAFPLLAGSAVGSELALVSKVNLYKLGAAVKNAKTNKGRDLQEEDLPVSPFCALTSSFHRDEKYWESLLPEPERDTSTGNLDYAFNTTTFAAYDVACNDLSGQTVSIDFAVDGNSCTNPYTIANFPQCMGLGCSEDDVSQLAEYGGDLIALGIKKGDPATECATLTVKSAVSDGDGDQFPNIQGTCLDDMVLITTDSDLYEGDHVNTTTGKFTGNDEKYEAFKKGCSNASGRTVTVNMDNVDTCYHLSDLVEVPMCISDSCTNDDAVVFFQILSAAGNDPECKGVTVEIIGDDQGTSAAQSVTFSAILMVFVLAMATHLLLVKF